MNRNFIKLHGAGNDFILLDGGTESVPKSEECRRLCDRRRGIGCDQLMIITSTDKIDSVRLDFFNADGGVAEACGNGTRCAAWWYMQNQGIDILNISVGAKLLIAERKGNQIWVQMGKPVLGDDAVGYVRPSVADIWETLDVDGLKINSATTVSMGNPHLVLSLAQAPSDQQVQRVGQAIAQHPAFVQSVNVGFLWHEAQNLPHHWHLRVWERGVGETLACGTGACAAFAALDQNIQCDNITLAMLGGNLYAHSESEGIRLSGPVAMTFSGEWYE